MLLIRSLKLTILAFAAVLVLGAASAAAANEIEGVWSFNGGSVAIQPLPNGTFQGTVLAATQFGTCTHPAEEVMWTGMTQQTDGSLWGFHQWYNDTSGACTLDSQLGPTAWRVLHNSTGVLLKVCFSHPGTSQPKIASNGTVTEATFGCDESALIANLPPVSPVSGSAPPLGTTVVLPNAKACVSQTSLKIKLKNPKNDALKEVVVKIGSKKVADVKGVKALAKALKKGITLKHLPSGTYKISVTATTVLKQQLMGSQTYKACTTGSGNIKLKKTHHG